MRIFLTGKPGCGKSRIIQKIIAKLKAKGLKISGIVTPEIRKNSVRYGFEIIDIASGKKGILAAADIKTKFKVGKYYVNVGDTDKIISEFEKSLYQSDLAVIDEIGKMEFFSEKFKNVLKEVLNSDKPLLAALHRNLVREFEKHGEVIWVDEKNRDNLAENILEKLRFILNQNKNKLRWYFGKGKKYKKA